MFSKLPILETFFHRYHLNGQAYKVQHGDWFGGKGVGLCKMEFQGFKVSLYATHVGLHSSAIHGCFLSSPVHVNIEMCVYV